MPTFVVNESPFFMKWSDGSGKWDITNQNLMYTNASVRGGNNQFQNIEHYFLISGLLLLLLFRPTDPIFFIHLPAKLEIKLVSPETRIKVGEFFLPKMD